MKHATVFAIFLLAFVGGGAHAAWSAHRSEDVRFTSGSNELAGTLVLPAVVEEGGSGAVVILAGSDRSARGPLRMRLAEQFAEHGVAALVYDSPGTGRSTGNARLQTLDDRADEARDAADYLRRLPGIDGASVGIFGGSEGANVALIAGARDPRAAFVIAVSGSVGTPVLDVLRYAAEKTGHAQGLTVAEIARAITFKEITFALLSGADIVEWPVIEARVAPWQGEPWAALIDVAKGRQKGIDPARQEHAFESFRGVVGEFARERWFEAVDVNDAVQRLAGLDAGTFFALLEGGGYARDWDRSLCADVAAVRCPVLALWGEEDTFLPPHQSAARLRKMLADAGHADYTIRIFEGAGHFLTTAGPDGEFAPGYIDTLVDWVHEQR